MQLGFSQETRTDEFHGFVILCRSQMGWILIHNSLVALEPLLNFDSCWGPFQIWKSGRARSLGLKPRQFWVFLPSFRLKLSSQTNSAAWQTENSQFPEYHQSQTPWCSRHSVYTTFLDFCCRLPDFCWFSFDLSQSYADFELFLLAQLLVWSGIAS